MRSGPDDPPRIDVAKLRVELDALGAADFLPDGIPDEPPVEPDLTVCFDD